MGKDGSGGFGRLDDKSPASGSGMRGSFSQTINRMASEMEWNMIMNHMWSAMKHDKESNMKSNKI